LEIIMNSKHDLRARFLKALAHPARVYIVERICQADICVCKLAEEIGSDITTVSKHLAILKQAGIVRVEKRGTQIFPKLKMAGIDRLLSLIDDAICTNIQEIRQVMQ